MRFRTAPCPMVISLDRMLPHGSCSLPGTRKETDSLLPPKRTGPCLALLLLGVTWPPHHNGAGGLLHHHFTLTLAGGVFLWPDPAGSSEESPPRVLPGSMSCRVRTFLDTDFSAPRPSGWPDVSIIPSRGRFVNLNSSGGSFGFIIVKIFQSHPHKFDCEVRGLYEKTIGCR